MISPHPRSPLFPYTTLFRSYMTTLGYRIVPTVARVEPGFHLTLNHDEVDDVFEVPLAFLMAEENHALHSRDRKSTRLNSSHANISYAVFCLKKKKLDHPHRD